MMSLNDFFYPKSEQVWIYGMKNWGSDSTSGSNPHEGSDEVKSPHGSNSDSDAVSDLEDEEESNDSNEDPGNDEEEQSKNSDTESGEKGESSDSQQAPDSDDEEAETDDRVVLRGMPYVPYYTAWPTTQADEALPKDPNEKTHVFRVPMDCPHCERSVATALRQLSGVRSVECIWFKEIVTVTGTAAAADLLSECQSLFAKSAMWND